MMNKEENMERKKELWVIDETEGWKKTVIKSEDATVMTGIDDKKYRLTDVHQINPSKFDMVNDLCELSYLNEPSVLHTLKTRYDVRKIYTDSGMFHISVNPYTRGDDDEEVREKIRSLQYEEPHIYKVAQKAYDHMVESRTDQSILVTGESGSGKTENTRKLIEYFGGGESSETNEMLVMCNPILEAFGNAKTRKNDNSSRFGKFVQIFFKAKKIVGGKITKYLLELSRLVNHNRSERTFHIFYYLLSCRDEDLLSSLRLSGKRASDFELLRHGDTAECEIDDPENFKRLLVGLEIFNIDQSKVFRTIAGILHLSNLEFVAENERPVLASSSPDVEFVCGLLGISVEHFKAAVVDPKISAGKETVRVDRTVAHTRTLVESFEKTVYNELFVSVVDSINETFLSRVPYENFIGILDIAGFEVFEANGYEQLLINYTNEKLQSFFNTTMFVNEQKDYAQEGVEWDFIDFGLGEEALSAMESMNPIGILAYIDEESVMPGATDESLLRKILGVKNVRSVKFETMQFELCHYAGPVRYTVEGWIEKNKNSSSYEFDALGKFPTRNSSVKNGLFRTLCYEHKENLQLLMNQLRSTVPYFVRCILPNLEKKPMVFDRKLVSQQLRCNGVLEGLRISRLGYPTRIPLQEFYHRFIFLNVEDCEGKTLNDKVYILLCFMMNELHIVSSREDFFIGKTKVFFKQGILADLENERSFRLKEVARVVQAALRYKMLLHKQMRMKERKSAILILRKNLARAAAMQKSPWWISFVTVRPLLDVHQKALEDRNRVKEVEALRKQVDLMAVDMRTRDELIEGLRTEKAKESEEIERLVQKLDECQQMVDGMRTAHSEAMENVTRRANEMDDRCSQLYKEKADLELELTKRSFEISELKQQLGACKSEKLSLQATIREKTADCLIAEKHVRDLENLVEKKGEEGIQALARAMRSKEDEIIALADQLHTSKEDLRLSRKSVADAVAEARETRIKLRAALNRVSQTSVELENSETARHRDEKKFVSAQATHCKEIAMHEAVIEKLKNSHAEIVQANESLLSDLNKLKSHEMHVESTIDGLSESNSYLEEKVTKLTNFINENIQSSQNDSQPLLLSGLEEKISAMEILVEKLKAEKSSLHAENVKLVEDRMNEIFTREVDLKNMKSSYVCEISNLKNEILKLKDNQVQNYSCDFSYDKFMEIQKANLSKIKELENTNFLLQNKICLFDKTGSAQHELQLIREQVVALSRHFTDKFHAIITAKEAEVRDIIRNMQESALSPALVTEISSLRLQNTQLKKSLEATRANFDVVKKELVDELKMKVDHVDAVENDLKNLVAATSSLISRNFSEKFLSIENQSEDRMRYFLSTLDKTDESCDALGAANIEIQKLKIENNQLERENSDLNVELAMVKECYELINK